MEKKVIEEFKITLTEEYAITRSGHNFILEFVSKNVTKKRYRGEIKESRETYSGYYGTLYQCLQGFVKHYYENKSTTLDEVVQRVEEAMGIINSAMEAMNSADKALVENYKVVKVSAQ